MNNSVSERLRTTFAGVAMRSPVGVAPVNIPRGERSAITPEVHAGVLLRHVEAGAGFVYMPGMDYIPEKLVAELRPRARHRDSVLREKGSRFMRIETPGHGLEGLWHFGMTSVLSAEANLKSFDLMRKTLDIVKKGLPQDVAIFAVCSPIGDFPESGVASAKKAEELGVDLIEINFGCGLVPSVEGAVDYYLEKDFPLMMCGSLVGEHFDLVQRVVREVVGAVRVPVGVKLTTEIGFPRVVGLARSLRDIGAKYIEVYNFAPTIAPPDIYNQGKSRWPYLDGNPFVAGSGSWLRMGCYKNVAAVARFAPGIEIAASGGLSTPEHAIEVMMLGAGIAEFCTSILLEGRAFLRKTVEFLETFMKEQGYARVEDLVGIGVPYIEPSDRIAFYPGRVKAKVDPERCRGSGLCTDHICVAMVRENGKAKVRTEACDGCGLCVQNCPSGAITLELLE